MQEVLPQIEKLGGKLVAVSPESPDNTSELVGKHDLKFSVLYDRNNAVARKYRIVFTIPKALDDLHIKYGLDVKARNAAEQAELPLAATYVIGKDGHIKYAYLNEKYYERAEPADILAVLEKLRREE
jgi:peroxiredoxin